MNGDPGSTESIAQELEQTSPCHRHLVHLQHLALSITSTKWGARLLLHHPNRHQDLRGDGETSLPSPGHGRWTHLQEAQESASAPHTSLRLEPAHH